MKAVLSYALPLKAPIAVGQQVGTMKITAPDSFDKHSRFMRREFSVSRAGFFSRILLGLRSSLGRHNQVTYGRFITLEGGEGTGKHAGQAAGKRLALAQLVTREPGGSPGAAGRYPQIARAWRTRSLDVLTGIEALFAARTDHIARTIKPALAAGKWVIW